MFSPRENQLKDAVGAGMDQHEVKGIDVSHHQGRIVWRKVAKAGISFVYMKATEGNDFVDPSFRANWAGAKAAGLARGAYHFFTLCSPGREQAENYLRVVPKDTNSLPPALDLELFGSCTKRPTREKVLHEIRVWLELVEARYNKRAVLYTSGEFYKVYLSGGGLNRPFWATSLSGKPAYGPEWLLWQYHNEGTIAGIGEKVDLNVLARGKTMRDLLGEVSRGNDVGEGNNG